MISTIVPDTNKKKTILETSVLLCLLGSDWSLSNHWGNRHDANGDGNEWAGWRCNLRLDRWNRVIHKKVFHKSEENMHRKIKMN